MSEEYEGIMHTGANVKDLADPLEGSYIETCHNCGDEVWISPGAVDWLKGEQPELAHTIIYQCGRCYIKEVGIEETKDLYMRVMLGLDLPEGNIAMPDTADIVREHMEKLNDGT